jgi:glycerophosphoryl diester phosphodiesterase
MRDIHPYLDWPEPIPFAHRGGTSDAPENTIGAFESAVALGYTYLETDVHLSADGILVAFHDADLLRTCGIDRTISSMTVRELADVSVDGRASIPLLHDLLDRFEGARFNIDCKSDAAAPALIDTVRRRALHDRVCLGSFSHRRLTKLRSLLGERLLTCMSPQEVVRLRVVGSISGTAQRVAQVPRRASAGWLDVTVVDERFVRSAHRRGLHVHVWTVDDPTEMSQLLDLGVDGIMTDHPAVLRDVLERRRQWWSR